MLDHARLVVLAACLLAFAPHAAPAQEPPPNIVFILADDLGYHELGCFGQEKIRTPNIDRLAEQGARLTRHYAGNPVCAPSRCVFLTGKHTGHAVIRGNKEVGGWGPDEPEGQWPLPAGEVTLAEVLESRGYATGAFGKWGLGGPGSEGHPCFQGFDHFYGYLCQRVAHNYYPTHLWRNHDVDVLDGNRYFSAHQKLAEPPTDESAYDRYRGEKYSETEIADEAIGWLKQQQGRPFFLYYASPIPHVALQAPREWIDTYPREWDDTPYLGQQGYLPTPRPRATYAAMISFLDHNVGRILQMLDEMGAGDNTIVVFTSDNGTTWAGGCDRAFFNSLGEFRGQKGTVFEGGIRVPTIVRWPGHVEPGATIDALSGFEDWLPTFADLAGAEPPSGVDGLDLLAVLRGQGTIGDRFIYREHPEGNQQQTLVFERFKAVRTNLRNGKTGIMLFDLRADPSETTDVADEHPEIVEQCERIMRDQHVPSELFPIKALDELSARD